MRLASALPVVASAVIGFAAAAATRTSTPEQPMDENGRYVNLDGSKPQTFGAFFKWAVVDKLAGRRRKSDARFDTPRVDPDLAAIGRPPAAGEGARLTWLGHATWLVQLDGVSLLVDPVLSESIPGFVKRNVPLPFPAEKLPRLDACLVSHSHFDHLDMPSLKQARATVLAGLGMREVISGEGLEVVELGWWKSTRVGPLTIHFVPSQHWSRRGIFDENKTLWGGFVIEGSSARLYHSGDTAYFEGFKMIGERFPDIDAAMLPIGAYDPEWFMTRQHMNPEQATQAFLDLNARDFLAMHWGTFKLTDEPLGEPPVRLAAEWKRRELPVEKRRVLAIGESFTVRRPAAPASR